MEDKYAEVLEKYNFKVMNCSRGRGSLILETDDGYKIVKETRTSAGRLVWENKVKSHLVANGFEKIDSFNLNNDGNISTTIQNGLRYVVRDWYIGEECNLNNINEIYLAAKNLGELHANMKGISPDGEGMCSGSEDIVIAFRRHNAEMKHIKNYLRTKREKNSFELALLKAFPQFYEQCENAVSMLEGELYRDLYDKSRELGEVCHGSYTYHNVLMCEDGIATTVFDKCSFGLQLMDVYYFLRKVMEKNNWKAEYGNALIDGYESVNKIDDEHREILGILLLYPEKFWKLSSHYMNGKKTWISNKNVEKLEVLCNQFENRNEFVASIMH